MQNYNYFFPISSLDQLKIKEEGTTSVERLWITVIFYYMHIIFICRCRLFQLSVIGFLQNSIKPYDQVRDGIL